MQSYTKREKPKNTQKSDPDSGDKYVDSRFQIQLKKDGGSSTGQSCMESSNLQVAWSSGNAFHPFNEVTLHRDELVRWWVTACRQVNHLSM